MSRSNLADLARLVEQVAAETSIRLLGVDAVLTEIERSLETVHRAVAELRRQVHELGERVDRHLPEREI